MDVAGRGRILATSQDRGYISGLAWTLVGWGGSAGWMAEVGKERVLGERCRLGASQVSVVWGQLRLGRAGRGQGEQWDESGRPRAFGQGLEGKRAGRQVAVYRDPHFHFPGPPHGSQMTWTLSCAWPALSSSLAGGPCSSTVSCCARTRTMCMNGTSAWPCTRAVPGRCVTAPYPQSCVPHPTFTCHGPSHPA